MTYYLYFTHLGAFFTADHELDDMDIYCELCGEYDELVGKFKTKEELIQLLVMDDDTYDEVIDEVVDSWEKTYGKGLN